MQTSGRSPKIIDFYYNLCYNLASLGNRPNTHSCSLAYPSLTRLARERFNNMEEREAALVVFDETGTTCSACNGSADPEEQRHTSCPDPVESTEKGCGAEFVGATVLRRGSLASARRTGHPIVNVDALIPYSEQS